MFQLKGLITTHSLTMIRLPTNLENQIAKIVLKEGREKSVKNFHPWIFSGAIDRIAGNFVQGDLISVYSQNDICLCKGFVNTNSQITVRVLTFSDENISAEFFQKRIKQALRLREAIIPPNTNAYRLINAEGDLLPGLIIDKYDTCLVMQISSIGVSRIKNLIVELLIELSNSESIIEKSLGKSLQMERMKPVMEVLYGEIRNPVQIYENGIKFLVDITGGQKTGFFLDQRENRQLISTLSKDKNVCNCFSYTGGFSLYAALNNANTTSVESNQNAQDLAKKNFELNNLDPDKHEFITANVLEFLRNSPDTFDIIILDPPAFVKRKQDLLRGTRGYKDINRLAMQRIRNDGILLSCSCSNFVDWELFQKIIYSAAKETGRKAKILRRLGQPADHPINLYHPEGEYLKAFLLQISD